MYVLEKQNTKYEKRIIFPENEVDFLEKRIYNTSIEIRNLPMLPRKDKLSMLALFKGIGVQNLFRKRIMKVYSFSKNGTLIFTFVSNINRDSFISAFRSQNKIRKQTVIIEYLRHQPTSFF